MDIIHCLFVEFCLCINVALVFVHFHLCFSFFCSILPIYYKVVDVLLLAIFNNWLQYTHLYAHQYFLVSVHALQLPSLCCVSCTFLQKFWLIVVQKFVVFWLLGLSFWWFNLKSKIWLNFKYLLKIFNGICYCMWKSMQVVQILQVLL